MITPRIADHRRSRHGKRGNSRHVASHQEKLPPDRLGAGDVVLADERTVPHRIRQYRHRFVYRGIVPGLLLIATRPTKYRQALSDRNTAL